jgi:hypothetical protein
MRDQPQIRVPVRTIILGSFLVLLAAWAFAFFTEPGWSYFTAFTEMAGRTQALGPAMHAVYLAGGGPTPAPALLLFAPLVPPFGVLIWSLSLLNRIRNAPYDPMERYRPREQMNWRTVPLHILLLLLVFHAMAGFPLIVGLIGASFLTSAWPALAVGAATMALTSLALALIFRSAAARD